MNITNHIHHNGVEVETVAAASFLPLEEAREAGSEPLDSEILVPELVPIRRGYDLRSVDIVVVTTELLGPAQGRAAHPASGGAARFTRTGTRRCASIPKLTFVTAWVAAPAATQSI